MARLDVRKGQRFCNADAPFIVWIVMDHFEDGAGLPHARLARAGDPKTVKTVSFSALRDPRLYRFIGESQSDRESA
jgi:hypothetical protein